MTADQFQPTADFYPTASDPQDDIAALIHSETKHVLAPALVARMAQLILAQLAHVHRLAPQPTGIDDDLLVANRIYAQRERALAALLKVSGIVVHLGEDRIPTSLIFDQKSTDDLYAESLQVVDDILRRSPIVDHGFDTPGRAETLRKLVERAEEADRLEAQWRAVLAAEQALSRSYVRIRDAVGATDPPSIYTWNAAAAKEEHIPLEELSGVFADVGVHGSVPLMWAWTEHCVKNLVRRLKKVEDALR